MIKVKDFNVGDKVYILRNQNLREGIVTKRGRLYVTVDDYDFHNGIEISFDDCQAEIERIDWQKHDIKMDHRFEVKIFRFKKYSRMINHIAAYLDRITVYDRVAKDDVSVAEFLPTFTLAQITEFIRIAQENNATNVTALLLNYKNENFGDFDPMAEFTLD